MCIFGGPDEWATARVLMPSAYGQVRAKELASGFTIHRTQPIDALADAGLPLCDVAEMDQHRRALLSRTYDGPILCDPGDWRLPSGAFRNGGGPT